MAGQFDQRPELGVIFAVSVLIKFGQAHTTSFSASTDAFFALFIYLGVF